MKQIIVKSVFLLATLMMSAKAFAYDFEVDGICYNILSETTCQVAYKNFSEGHYEGSVAIPEQVTYNGITRVVTAIGDFAFNGCENLTNIYIPNSVTSIDQGAFKECSSLTSIDIPNSITTIDDWAFGNCTNLENVNIGDAVTTINFCTFAGCTNLKSVDIGHAVTKIDDYAFYGCENLTNIDIPNSVTTIDRYVFNGCENLTNIYIPNSVTSIDHGAFMNCYSLTSIDIPNSITTIDDWAFGNCTNLKSISIPNSITKIFPNTFKGCSNLRGVAFENGEEELEVNSQAFEGCPIEKLYLGRNLTCPESSDPSLCNLTTLADVTIGNLVTDVTTIDWTKNENLKSIHLLSPTPPTSNSFSSSQYENVIVFVPIGSLSAYQSNANWGKFGNLQEGTDDTGFTEEDENVESDGTIRKDGLAYKMLSETTCEVICCYNKFGQRIPYEGDVVIPEHITYERQTMTVTAIGESAFSQCTELRSIEIPKTITEIGIRAFWKCTNLLGIDLPNSVSSIGEGAFSGCSSLTSLNIPDPVTDIKHKTFSGCTSLMSVDIPNSVATIGSYAFSVCSYLLNVNIPNSVATIDEGAFYGCLNLTNVRLSNSLISIGDYAFQGCTSIVNMSIPNSITTIGIAAFKDCSITELTIEDGENLLDMDVFSSAFYGCPVERLYIGRNISGYMKFCTLTDLTFGNFVTTIYPGAFGGCSNLKNLVFEDGKEYLEVHSEAFNGCPIEQLYLGRNLTWQESSSSSRSNLTTLADVTIGSLVADVTAIDWTKNESLLSIKSFAATPPISGKFTNPQYMNLKVSVPSGSLSSYKEDIVWRNFWNLQDDLPSAASIGEIPAPQSIKAADGRIIVENAQGRIEVYALSGILMESLPAQGGTTEIHLPQGVYIVKAGGETVKVIL